MGHDFFEKVERAEVFALRDAERNRVGAVAVPSERKRAVRAYLDRRGEDGRPEPVE